MPKCFAAHLTPSPPATNRVPSHNRWATQSGAPIQLKNEYHGPDGHR